MNERGVSGRGGEGRLAVVGIVMVAVLIVGYFALGMPGMDHGGEGSSMPGMDHESAAEAMGLDPDEFARQMAASKAFVVNVHVPDGEVIDGTDESIAFDRLVGDDRLPTDPSTPILLYCQTGRMSAVAADELTAEGYTDVAYLEGGTDAWSASGRSPR